MTKLLVFFASSELILPPCFHIDIAHILARWTLIIIITLLNHFQENNFSSWNEKDQWTRDNGLDKGCIMFCEVLWRFRVGWTSTESWSKIPSQPSPTKTNHQRYNATINNPLTLFLVVEESEARWAATDPRTFMLRSTNSVLWRAADAPRRTSGV